MKILKKILYIEIIVLFFYIGAILGINTAKEYKEEELTKTYIELDSEKEKSYQLELENKKLNTILNNCTIEERKK